MNIFVIISHISFWCSLYTAMPMKPAVKVILLILWLLAQQSASAMAVSYMSAGSKDAAADMKMMHASASMMETVDCHSDTPLDSTDSMTSCCDLECQCCAGSCSSYPMIYNAYEVSGPQSEFLETSPPSSPLSRASALFRPPILG